MNFVKVLLKEQSVPVFVNQILLAKESAEANSRQGNHIIGGINGFDFV